MTDAMNGSDARKFYSVLEQTHNELNTANMTKSSQKLVRLTAEIPRL